MESVGIRELRQNASAVVARAEAGETITVTQRGRPVALITPLPTLAGTLKERVAMGLVRPPKRAFSEIPPPLPAVPGRALSEIVDELREDTT